MNNKQTENKTNIAPNKYIETFYLMALRETKTIPAQFTYTTQFTIIIAQCRIFFCAHFHSDSCVQKLLCGDQVCIRDCFRPAHWTLVANRETLNHKSIAYRVTPIKTNTITIACAYRRTYMSTHGIFVGHYSQQCYRIWTAPIRFASITTYVVAAVCHIDPCTGTHTKKKYYCYL